MNRGFGFYFGQAVKSSAKTIFTKGNLLKYLAWTIMELFACISVILAPMFALANVRQAKIAQRENTVDIPQSFKVACRAKPFWTTFLAVILEGLIVVAGIALIGMASAVLGAVGYVISLFADGVDPKLLVLIFLAPGALALLVYSVIMPLLLAPTAYIIETNPDIGAADAISICFNTMKSRGKFTYFLNLFIPALIIGAVLGLWAGTEFALVTFIEDGSLSTALAVLAALIFFVGFVLVASLFTLASKISNKDLFEDIVLDPVNASKRTNGVNIRKCKGVKFDPAEYENELAMLFDETYGDRVPLPESPSAMRKRALEERQAAKARSFAYTQPASTPSYNPAPVSADKSSAGEEEEDLLTVSDLIRDVAPEEADSESVLTADAPVTSAATEEAPAAAQPAEEPANAVPSGAPAVEEAPAATEQTEPAAEPPVATEESAQPADNPVLTTDKAQEEKGGSPESAPAPKKTAAKSKSASTATKTAKAKTSSTATKSVATKTASAAAKSKKAGTASTATKSATAKTTAAKKTVKKTENDGEEN